MRPESAQLLEQLLEWDRRRIAARRLKHPGRDYRDYEARQARAAATLRSGAPPRTWPSEVRTYFRVLLEVTGEAAMLPAAARTAREGDGRTARGLGDRLARARNLPKPPTAASAAAVLAAAEDIGELAVLQRAGASCWGGRP